MKQSGIGLLELVIGLAVSFLVMTFVYQSFFVVQRSNTTIESLIYSDNSHAMLHRIVVRDIAGIHVVEHPSVEDIKQLKEQAKKKSGEQSASESTETAIDLKPIADQFAISNSDGKIQFTFITNNIRTSIDPLKQHPYGAMRVWYFCKETGDTGLTLFRAESPDYAHSELKSSTKSFGLLGFIRKFELYCFAPELPINEKKDSSKEEKTAETVDKKDTGQKKEPVYPYKKFGNWPTDMYTVKKEDAKDKAGEISNHPVFQIPHFVIMRITQQKPNELERIITIPCIIDAYSGYLYDFNHSKTKKPETKPLTPPASDEKKTEKAKVPESPAPTINTLKQPPSKLDEISKTLVDLLGKFNLRPRS